MAVVAAASCDDEDKRSLPLPRITISKGSSGRNARHGERYASKRSTVQKKAHREDSLHSEVATPQSTSTSSKKFMVEALRPSSPSDRQENGFLPSVRNVCPPLLLDSHPFFRGCRDEFKSEISDLVRLCRFEKPGSDVYAAELKELQRKKGILRELFQEQDNGVPHPVQRIFEQGKVPANKVDGVVLMFNEEHADVEMCFNGNRVSSYKHHATFGQEVAFGMSATSVFEVKILTEAKQPMYLVPRTALNKLLESPEFEQDVKMLRSRFAEEVNTLLVEHFRRSVGKVKVRLFANMGLEFKTEFLAGTRVRLCTEGASICTQGKKDTSLICLYQGEAKVKIDGQDVAELRSSPSAPAWAAWWGALEICSASSEWATSLCAATDCIIWEVAAPTIMSLNTQFASECRLFDKVALKHGQLLHNFTRNVWHKAYLFQDAESGFVELLAKASTQRLCAPKEVVVRSSALRGEEMYLLERGACSIFREHPDAVAGEFDIMRARQCGRLQKGNCFGDLALLGIGDHSETVVCDTVCDIRVLHRKAFIDACAVYPRVAQQMEHVVSNHQQRRDVVVSALSKLDSCQGMSADAWQQIASIMYERAFFSGQKLIAQGDVVEELCVVIRGSVAVEVDGEMVGKASAPLVFWDWALLKLALPSPATVRCATVCDCLVLPRGAADSDAFMEKCPEEVELLRQEASRLGDPKRGTAQNVTRQALQNLVERAGGADPGLRQSSKPRAEPGCVSARRGSAADARRHSKGLAAAHRATVKFNGSPPRPSAADARLGRERNWSPVPQLPDQQEAHSPRLQPRQSKWAANSFLAGCSAGFLDVLCLSLEKRYFLEGQLLLRQSDPGLHALFILDGSADVEVNADKVDEVACGDFLGELVLCGVSDVHTASVRATSMVRAFFIDCATMMEVIEDFPEDRAHLEELVEKRAKMRLSQIKCGTRLVAFLKKIRRKTAEAMQLKDALGRRTGAVGPMLTVSEEVVEALVAKAKTTGREDDFDDDDKEKLNLTEVGKEICGEWARRRKEALAEAPKLREIRQFGHSGVKELLHPEQSYKPSEVGLGTAFATTRTLATAPAVLPRVGAQRLQKTQRIYGRPVWCEVFGIPPPTSRACWRAAPGLQSCFSSR